MKRDKTGRRLFLQGLGACLALPVLPSLSRRAAAETLAPKPRRFFAIKSYSTQHLINWYPRFGGQGYRVRPFRPNDGSADGTTLLDRKLSTPSGVRRDGRQYFAGFAPLSELIQGGSISKILGPGFNRYADELLLLRGLDFMPETSHNDGGMLGNYAGATVSYSNVSAWPTIDQTLAFSKQVYPQKSLGPRSLHLSLGNRNTCSFTDNGVPGSAVVQVQAHTDPRTAFREVFGNLSVAERVERRKLVDRVLDDYRRLRGDPRLSGADRQTLEHHMGLLSELEGRLSAEPARACSAPPEPATGELKGIEAAEISRVSDLMVDLALAAFRCDLTRVVTLDVWKAVARGVGPGGSDFGYAHSAVKDPRDWHQRAHEFGQPEADAQILAINQWIANEVVKRVLDGLSREEENGESYLSRSLVFWGNELGMNHSNWSVPALVAGGAGGKLQTGRYIDYIDWQQPVRMTLENAPVIEGVPHNRFLVSVLQAFGLTPADYERGGQPGYGSYKTTGKSPTVHAIDYDVSRYGQPLPGLLR
ncbi:MAG TPA: DUF1552 domain-containing protein [Polyangiaceae bacterium]|nr:DUF1552 domain-containing protein [Polyangiaceae bacterium]